MGTRDSREAAAGGIVIPGAAAYVKNSSARKTKRDEDISLSPGAHSLTGALFFGLCREGFIWWRGEKVNDLSRLFLWACLCMYMEGEKAIEYGLLRLTPEQSVWGNTAAYWLDSGFRVLTA